jgi:hypothetical protein
MNSSMNKVAEAAELRFSEAFGGVSRELALD